MPTSSEDVKRKRGTKNPGDHEIQTWDLLIQGIGVPRPAWLPWILKIFDCKKKIFCFENFCVCENFLIEVNSFFSRL